MQLKSPEDLKLAEFQQTFCEDINEIFNANCIGAGSSPICMSIRFSFKERCRDESDSSKGSDLTLENTLELATALLLYFIISGMLQHTKFSYLPEAGAAILIGLACGGAVYVIHGHFTCEFDEAFFFEILLPFIILEAGLCVDKRMLASNMGTILSYAALGTLFSSFTVGALVYGGSKLSGDELPLLECFIFGTLISSIDPIATLSIFSSFGVENSLYILVFGESMLNDGVAVVLFKGLVGLLGSEVDGSAIGKLVIDFIICVAGSVLCAVVTAIVSSYSFKLCWGKIVSHDGEVLLFIIAALVPYYFCERLGWSGIVSIMTTGMQSTINVITAHIDSLN